MVGKIGWRSGEAGQGVCPMPEGGELVCSCPLTPMAIAIQTLGTCPSGLCSPLSGKDVPGGCRGTVKVAGSCGNVYHHSFSDSNSVNEDVFSQWIT